MPPLSRSTVLCLALLSIHCTRTSSVAPSDPPTASAAVVVAADVTAPAPEAAPPAPAITEPEAAVAAPAIEADAGTPPCLTAAEVERIANATPNLGPRRRADWRYSELRCSGAWAAVLSSPRVRGTTDAMRIVFRFRDGQWRAVTWGSSVADEVPAEHRGALGL